MLEVLRRRELTDTVAVVTRWFGGVLLGTGGLVRAYGSAVSGAVDEAGVLVREPVALLAVGADHARGGALEHALRAAGRTVRDVAYTADGVRIELAVPLGAVPDVRRWLAETTGGTATVTELGQAYADT
jgi:putative IMPACT (imprinted ancient) family translation regulator